MRKSVSRRKLFAIGCLAVLAAGVSVCARLGPYFPGDVTLARALQSVDSQTLLRATQLASWLFTGWPAGLLVIIAGLVAWRRLGRLEAILIILAGMLSQLQSPLKLAVGRPRPSPDLVQVLALESEGGFPSGHSLFAILFLGILAYFAAGRLKSRSVRVAVVACLAALILLVGASRVYLGVHWPSDVIGGYLIGGVFLMGLAWFYQTRIERRGITNTQGRLHDTERV